ncbi:hypothetical protein [Nostoc sp.]
MAIFRFPFNCDISISLVIVVERLEYGVDAVKELLSTLTSDERCGVMLEFEDACQDLFAQLVTDAPQWTEWIV